MKTSVQQVSEIEIKVDVEIPAADVDTELSKQLRIVGKKARIKGFRPGKAPRAIIKKNFASTIAQEATRNLISGSLEEVIGSLTHTPLGEPSIEPGIAKEGEPLNFAVRLQVKPEIKLKKWKKVAVAVPPAVVDSAEIDAELQRRREQQKERVPVEGRKADTGDVVIATLSGTIDGEPDPRLDATDLEIVIGSGRMIEGFEDQLIGAEVGATMAIEVTFPDDYFSEELQGKNAVFSADVTGIFSEELPDLDDDFAQDLGFDTLDALRQDIISKNQSKLDTERQHQIEQKVMAEVLERNPFKVPPALHSAFTNERLRQTMAMFQMQGIPEQQAIELIRNNIESVQNGAYASARRHLALEALAASEKIDIDDDALSAEIVKRIQEQGERAGKLYEREEMRDSLREELVQKQTMALIVEHAIITDEAPSAAEDKEEDA